MELKNDMRVDVAIGEAWQLLTDIPAIAPCLPGAELTGQTDDEYQGRLLVKVGPITAQYEGTARITEMDSADRRVLLTAKGRDTRGAGNAAAEIVAEMEPDGTGTRVTITTQLKISGKVAQLGRGVMADVSKKLLDQFASCVEQSLTEAATDSGAGAANAEPSEAQPIELLEVAGGAVVKRLAPIAAAGAALLLMYLVVRRILWK